MKPEREKVRQCLNFEIANEKPVHCIKRLVDECSMCKLQRRGRKMSLNSSANHFANPIVGNDALINNSIAAGFVH